LTISTKKYNFMIKMMLYLKQIFLLISFLRIYLSVF